MIQEEYVSFDVAKLLKEKGFNEECRTYYKVFPKNRIAAIYHSSENRGVSEDDPNEILCPTQQMTMRWLREEKGLFISIGNDDLDYNWQIFDVKNRTKDLDPTCLTESYAGYKTYEEACEAAIKYCLENLIK